MIPPHASAGWKQELGKHLLVAVLTGSVVLVVAHTGYLNWLESLSLRIAAVSSNRPGQLTAMAGDPDTPVVLAVGETMYETAFRESAPLDRAVLAQALGKVAAQRPRLLVVDLDLSPGPDGAPDAAAQDQLDATLIRLAAEHAVRIELAAPLPVKSDALRKQKFAWMQKMCGAGLVFAQTGLTLSQAAVLRYDAEGTGLGQTAARIWAQPDRVFQGELCDLVASGERYAVFLSSLWLAVPVPSPENFERQRPIEARYLRSTASDPRPIDALDGAAGETDLTGRAVFIGANFNPSDSFLTAWGERPGVAIHAGIFVSALHPIAPLSHRIAFLLDIAIGVLAGVLFHFTWHRYALAERTVQTAPGSPLRAYGVARLWLMGNFALLIGIVLAFLYLSGLLFGYNIWVNPGPILIAVFFKNLLGSRAGLKLELDATALPREGWIGRADVLLLSPFVLLALFYLLRA
jgi:CHASE2 domain-containing sensor protein